MDRRVFLQSAAGYAALSTLAPATAALAAEPNEFHIAGILAFSGAYGIIGRDMRQGVELAIADRGGNVLGKPIRASWEDDETKPLPAVQKATRLLAGGAQMM
ncbi:ABC transporter substrate-binding protein, partial [Streptomyces sp. DH17]|nr:ABC transporter substrate-binding protein [Streptomyces sp. DH17]